MTLKQVQLSETTNDRVEKLCKQRAKKEQHGNKKRDIVKDAVDQLFEKEWDDEQ